MRFLSVCSGLGGAELAFAGLGWECAGVAEIDPAACAVLKHHWPGVKNFGDFTKIGVEDVGAIDLLVGGTPCQDFSVAGLRAGVDGDRGNLTLEFLRLADRLRPRWVVWENVPGVLSSTSHIAPDSCPPARDLDSGDGPQDGEEIVVEDEYEADENHAFACFLAGLSELGYEYAYGTLDAQHFGVPQRRRRVFVVGCIGDWASAAAVLFDWHCLSGHPPPCREAGKGTTHPVAPSLTGSGRGVERGGDSRGQNPVVPVFERRGVRLSKSRDESGADLERVSSSQLESISESRVPRAWGSNNTSGPIDVATACNAHGGPAGRLDFESETFVTGSLMNSGKAAGSATQQDAEAGMLVTAPVSCRPYADRGAEEYGLITHSLRGEGFDASEDGTGRGTPLVPVAYAIQERAICENPDAGPDGIGVRGDGTAYTVEARQVPRAVAFRAAGQDGFTSSAVCPPIASTDGGGAGVPTICFDSRQDTCCYEDHTGALDSSSPQAQAVAFVQNTRDEVRLMGGDGQSVGALSAEPGMKQQCYVAVGLDEEQNAHEEQMGYLKARKEGGGFEGSVMTPAMQVRRLTPVECERLQGVPDSFTAIPYRGKTMADGPRYKMLGNGFAIPVVSWIGSRIQQVEDLK